MPLPPILTAMLMGRAPLETKRRPRPMPSWTKLEGATHVSEGRFEVYEPDEPTERVKIEAVDSTVAQAMADEARALIRAKATS